VALSGKDCDEIRQALQSKATNYRYSDLARWLERAGFHVASRRGDHEVWKHGPSGRRVGIVMKPGNLLPAYVKEVARRILEVGACP
jgi:predicted RNA binding protein YcfA (HicA-like mRNA interferase family)